MKISIVGAGYVGLVSGLGLASQGHRVVCVDLDPAKVDRINAGEAPFYEPDLPALLAEQLRAGRFRAAVDLNAAVLDSEATFLAVGTPFDGQAIDLTFIRAAAEQVGAALRQKSGYHLVIVKSTVVPGTTDRVVLPLLESACGRRAGAELGVAANPEFLSEGSAVADFLRPDRIVIGGHDERSRQVLQSIYAGFRDVEKLQTNNRTAEMIKYASNSVLATMISYANEIGNLCTAVGGIDVVEVMRGVNLAHYFRPQSSMGEGVQAPISAFLQAGCGFGGSCLPKDVQALIRHGQDLGESMPLLRAVIDINDARPRKMLHLLRKHYPELQGRRVAVLGLAFKPDTDDIRLSPAIPILQALLAAQAEVTAYDPQANDNTRRLLGGSRVQFCDSLAAAVEGAEALMLVTRWDEFRRLPEMLRGRNPQPLCVDGRRMLERTSLERYEGIGA